VVAELLVAPFRAGQSDSARRLRAAIEQLPGLELIEVDTPLAVEAARLRGTAAITVADAVHAVTAAAHADALLTNDRRLRAVQDHTPILILDDLVPT
jgi:predicted nucleic acid-binding protein